MRKVHPKVPCGCLWRLSILERMPHNALVSARGCEGTFASMRGNTPDVQIHLWFSSWNIAMLSGAQNILLTPIKSLF